MTGLGLALYLAAFVLGSLGPSPKLTADWILLAFVAGTAIMVLGVPMVAVAQWLARRRAGWPAARHALLLMGAMIPINVGLGVASIAAMLVLFSILS